MTTLCPVRFIDAQIATELPADGSYVVIASRYVGPDADPTSGTPPGLLLERVGSPAEPESPATTAEPQIVPLSYGETEAGGHGRPIPALLRLRRPGR